MNKDLKKIIRITSGVLLILGGIAGLFLPIIQGIALIIAGILLVHPPLGKKLIKQAEKITKNNNINKLSIISGVGVRQYYRKLGYKLTENYMFKKFIN